MGGMLAGTCKTAKSAFSNWPGRSDRTSKVSHPGFPGRSKAVVHRSRTALSTLPQSVSRLASSEVVTVQPFTPATRLDLLSIHSLSLSPSFSLCAMVRVSHSSDGPKRSSGGLTAHQLHGHATAEQRRAAPPLRIAVLDNHQVLRHARIPPGRLVVAPLELARHGCAVADDRHVSTSESTSMSMCVCVASTTHRRSTGRACVRWVSPWAATTRSSPTAPPWWWMWPHSTDQQSNTTTVPCPAAGSPVLCGAYSGRPSARGVQHNWRTSCTRKTHGWRIPHGSPRNDLNVVGISLILFVTVRTICAHAVSTLENRHNTTASCTPYPTRLPGEARQICSLRTKRSALQSNLRRREIRIPPPTPFSPHTPRCSRLLAGCKPALGFDFLALLDEHVKQLSLDEILQKLRTAGRYDFRHFSSMI
jgi:hypothetical protein